MSVRDLVQYYLDEQTIIAMNFPVYKAEKLFKAVEYSYQEGGRVFIMGNGGGASIAEHFASDLGMHPFVSEDKHRAREAPRFEVHCLNESNGLMTRIANDIGYDYIFTEQLKSYKLNNKDLLIVFSGSGNSPNVVGAIKYVREFGVITALVGGRKGGKARSLVDICLLIPGSSKFPGQTGANDNCFHIEDFQASISHMMTGLLRRLIDGQVIKHSDTTS